MKLVRQSLEQEGVLGVQIRPQIQKIEETQIHYRQAHINKLLI